MFEVIAGTWEEFSESNHAVANCKVSLEFETFEEAFSKYKECSTYTWSALIFNGDVVTGYSPFNA